MTYLAILSHHARDKEKLSTLSELTKSLENKQMRPSNQNRGTANYAYSFTPKKAKPSEEKKKERTNKQYDSEMIRQFKSWKCEQYMKASISEMVDT